MKPKKSFGQHFLLNNGTLTFISRFVNPGDTVLEIGGGTGRLTSRLLNRNPKHLYVVELENDAFERLKERFSNIPNISLIHKDFLSLEPFPVDAIVGNIPYNISSKILFRLIDWDFKKAVLMFQKEFAKRLVSKPGQSTYGRLSITTQLHFNVSLLRNVPKMYFFPKPKVDSSIVLIEKKKTKYPEWLYDLIRLLFSQKNKKIKNILDDRWDVPSDLLGKRPRHLNINDILRIRLRNDEGENSD